MARKPKNYPTLADTTETNAQVEGADPLVADAPEKPLYDHPPAPGAAPVVDPLPTIDYPTDFELSYKLVLAHEGGFVNHPRDPGGATNLGISLRYAKTRGSMFDLDGDGDVDVDDIREVTLETAAPAYFADFWQAARCGELPAGVSHAVFDGAVNSGPSRAVRWLQDAVGAPVDGAIGPQTLAAVAATVAEIGPAHLADRIATARLIYLRNLPTWEAFGGGWRKRVERANLEAHKIALGMPL